MRFRLPSISCQPASSQADTLRVHYDLYRSRLQGSHTSTPVSQISSYPSAPLADVEALGVAVPLQVLCEAGQVSSSPQAVAEIISEHAKEDSGET